MDKVQNQNKIHVLDKSVYELIAAGEVVDRPASVVKEMVENSIDAGATKITVEIKNGGKLYIRITDNGCGMSKEDVPLAFVRHATSKISVKEDLDRIGTLGFRGEALASVSAVSKVQVMTKTRDEELGYLYVIEAGEEIKSETIGCPDGTTFVIRDLFYNIPARQKFMKKDLTEANAIAATLSKLALSHPEVSIKFIRENRTDFVTPGDGKLLSCIYTILGADFHDSCIPLDYSFNGIHVSGYCTRPLASKATRGYQNFFVNHRYVRSATCIHALEEAYKDLIMVGKFPGCVINLDVNPDFLDVNTHPTKLEVRFKDEKDVYTAVYFAAKNSLAIHDSPAKIELRSSTDRRGFESFSAVNDYDAHDSAEQMTLNSYPAVNPFANGKDSYTFVSAEEGILSVMSDYKPIVKSDDSQSKKTDPPKPDTLDGFKFISAKSIARKSPAGDSASPENSQNDSTVCNADPLDADKETILQNGNAAEPETVNTDALPKKSAINETLPSDTNIRVIGEAFKTYIIAESGYDIVLIDKHAAHERYIYEQLKKSTDELDMQLLINEVKTSVPYEIYDALSAHIEDCRRLGVGIRLCDPPRIMVYGIPTIAGDIDPMEIVEKLSECFARGESDSAKLSAPEFFDGLYHSIACKAAIKANSETRLPELERLVEIITEDDLRYCPHGRPILTKLSKREIEKMFKRIV